MNRSKSPGRKRTYRRDSVSPARNARRSVSPHSSRENRNYRSEQQPYRSEKEHSRDARDSRDNYRDSKDYIEHSRDVRDSRDSRDNYRDSREHSRDPRDSRGSRDSGGEPRDSREDSSEKRPLSGGLRPSDELQIQGLNPNIPEPKMRAILKALDPRISTIKIPLQRETKLLRGFAFISFTEVEAARLFMEKHAPRIDIGGILCSLNYSKSSLSAANSDWICVKCANNNLAKRVICFKCKTPKAVADGSVDVGKNPTTLLLLRGLNALSTEESILGVITPLVHCKNVRMIRDRAYKTPLGIAFVEFENMEKANYFLEYATQNPIVLDDRTISVSYSHLNSFTSSSIQTKFTCSKTTDSRGTLYWSYWDANTYASYVVPPKVSRVPANAPLKDKMDAFMDDVSKTIQGESDEDQTPEIEPENGMPGFQKLLDKKALAKKETEKMTVQLQKWNHRQGELKDYEVEPITHFVEDLSDEALLKRLPSDQLVNDEHSDLAAVACLLCKRQFKSIEDLEKHQAKSALHKTTLEEYRKKQILELRERLVMDAKEQRFKRKQERKARFATIHAQKAEQAKEKEPEPVIVNNIGTQMLKSMGWEEGQGLGLKGDGITAPIEAISFANKAGIGQSSGIAVSKLTKNLQGNTQKKTLQTRREAVPVNEAGPIDSNNIGSRMLKNMGWSEGQGLGLNSDGMTDPIQVPKLAPKSGIGLNKKQ